MSNHGARNGLTLGLELTYTTCIMINVNVIVSDRHVAGNEQLSESLLQVT